MVGDDVSRSVGWIKSSTTEHVIPTDQTSWLFSPNIGDPTEADPTLKLKEAFDEDVEDIISDINDKPTSVLGPVLITRFNDLIPKKKEQVLLQIDNSKAETLTEIIRDDHLDEE